MSTLAAKHEAAPARVVAAPIRVPIAVVTLAGLAAGSGAAFLLATSPQLVDAVAYGVQVGIIVVGTVAVALVWIVRRPGNRLAAGLFALAFAAAGISLQGATSPTLHSIGVLFDAPVFLLGYYLVFAFPGGRLAGALETALVGAVTFLLLISFIPWFFFSPVVAGGAPLAGCNAACPRNAFMIANRPSIADGFGKSERYYAVGFAVAVVFALLYRFATSSRPQRRALLPVYVPALLLTVPFGLFQAAGAGLIQLDADATRTIGWFLTVGRTGLSFGFLLAVAQTAFFAGEALKTVVSRLVAEAHPRELRDLVAEALDDPSLELAFRMDEDGSFVDSRGGPIDPSKPNASQSSTALERDDRPVAYIIHDVGLDTDHELVQAVGQAILLALDSGRLESELQAARVELRASRARVVGARDAERRKIERDLHDGIQQQILAVLMKVGAARSSGTADRELARQLDEVDGDLVELLEDLRRLAHGVYPAVLRDFGLAEALRLVAKRSVPRPAFSVKTSGRYPSELETAVYFCCLEALQNATKHAGPGARTSLRLWEDGNDLCFEVADDGVGYDREAVSGEGTGVASMTQRVTALGGTLAIAASDGRGTRVRGTIPRIVPSAIATG